MYSSPPLTLTIRLLHAPIFKLEAASIHKRVIPGDKEYFRQKVKRQTTQGNQYRHVHTYSTLLKITLSFPIEIEELQANTAELEATLKENLKFFASFMSSVNKGNTMPMPPSCTHLIQLLIFLTNIS